MSEESPKIRVKLRGYDALVVDKSAKSIIEAAIGTGARVSGPIPLRKRKKIYAVNKSPHIYKSSMEHFKIETHMRLIDIIDPTPKTIEALQHLQMPAGVGFEIK